MAGFLQPIDEHLKRKINDLMAEGVRNVPEMSRHLNHYARHELFQGRSVPDKENRRFFPTKRAIRSHMYAASVRQQFSFIDQENVEATVEQWSLKNPQDCFFFRPHSFTKEADATGDANHLPEDDDNQKDDDVSVSFGEEETTKTLLFVHQTQDQRYLLERYGNKLCLLDAMYKTTRYALPLFFVAVKTNVDYQPVCAFVTQDETTSSIREALEILKSWNPAWQPEVFFTDYCEQEIGAIEGMFPCEYTLIYYHHHYRCRYRYRYR